MNSTDPNTEESAIPKQEWPIGPLPNPSGEAPEDPQDPQLNSPEPQAEKKDSGTSSPEWPSVSWP